MAVQGASPWEHQDGQLATADIIKGLAEGKVVASDIGATVLGITESNVRQYLLELMYAVVAGQLPAAKFAVGLKASGVKMEAQSPDVLVQLLWVGWTHLTYRETGTAEMKSNLVDLTKELEKAQLVNKDVLVRNSDRFFLEEVGAITKVENLRKREVQVNTRIYYAQKRFNLLSEESEGFAKLLNALLRFDKVSMDPAHVKSLVKEVKALIGFFDLDPKRVYDIVLEAWEQVPDQEAFLQLTALFSQDARTQILGFRFTRLANDDAAAGSDALYQVTAQLIKAGQIQLEAIFPHLGPSAEDTKAAHAKAIRDLEAAVAKIGSISLTQAANDKDPESRSQKVGLTAAKVELDARPLNEATLGAALRSNQFFGLTAALLEAGDWENGSQLLRHLTDLGVDPVAYPAIAKALCKMAREHVAPTFAGLYPDGLRGQCILARKDGGRTVSVQPLSENAISMLLLLGMHAYHDPQLLTQLARIFRHMTLSNSTLFASPATITEAHERASMMEQLMLDCLLPAMCMVPALTPLANEIWGALNLRDCTDRWRMYTALKARIEASPLMRAASKMASVETKKVLRRLHATGAQDKREKRRETAPFARLLGKASHANPLEVCKALVHQVEAYSVMSQPIVEALTYFTALSFDIMSFLIIERLAATGRPKIKEDGMNISDWLQALCVFTGKACLACDKMDVSSICQYVTDTLKQAESYDLLMLRSIVENMTGISLVTDVSGDQVEALAGGPLLQQQVLNQERNARQVTPKMQARASQRLAGALQKGMPQEQLALPLLVMLAQQRRFIAIQTQSGPLKLIAELYDKAQESLYLYVEFLSTALSPEAYCTILPSIAELVQTYQLDIEVALQAHRPLLRKLEPTHAVHDAFLPNGNIQLDDGEAEEGELEEGEAAEETKDVAMPDAVAEGGAGPETGAVAELPNHPAGDHPQEEDTKGWQEAMTDIRAALPENVWESISPEFYMEFWSLRYEDIVVPTDRYAKEQYSLDDQIRGKEEEVISLERLAGDLRHAEERQEQARQYQGYPPGMGGYQGGGGYPGGGGYQAGGGFGARRDNEPEMSLEHLLENIELIKQNIRDMKEVLKHMPGELAAKEEHVREMDKLLQARKGLWKNERASMVGVYIQHCVLPRVTYSPADAAFCAAFMQRLITFRAPWFPVFIYYDVVMKQLIYLLPTCTDREALNLAVFFHETLIIMERWRGSESTFSKECVGNPCASTGLTHSSSPSLKFSDYKRLCLKWQGSVSSALRTALASKEYVQTRNALLFLSYNSKVYPMVQKLGSDLKQAALAVRDQTDREDLRTMANMYSNNLDLEMKRGGRMFSEEVYSGQPAKRPPSGGAKTDSSNGKAADTAVAARTAKKAEPKPNAVPQAADAKAVADHSTEQRPADMEIEAGEVDVQKGNMLSPDAPEFKPGKDASASPATAAGAAAAAASSKRKNAEKASSAQARDQERKRLADKGERASKRQRTADIEAGELGEIPAPASKPPAASKPSAVPERQRPATDERRSQTERQGSVPRQLDGNAGSRTDRKAAGKEAEKLKRREERFAEKPSAQAKPSEPGEAPEPDRRSKRPTDSEIRKELNAASAPARKVEDGKSGREHRSKDRDTPQHKDKDAAQPKDKDTAHHQDIDSAQPKDRDTAKHKDRVGANRSRHAPGKEEASNQPAGAVGQNGTADAAKHAEKEIKHGEKDAGHKARSAVHSNQQPSAGAKTDGSSGKAAATAVGAALKAASEPEARVKKPVVELKDLRERALRGRQPAAKQEETAAPAGEKKEPTRADVKSRSKKVLEAGHLEKAVKDTAAAEAPKPTKDAAPRASRLVAARSTNDAPKAQEQGDKSPEKPRRDLARQRLERPKAEVEMPAALKNKGIASRLGFPLKQESSSPRRRAPASAPSTDAPGEPLALAEELATQSADLEALDANGTKAKKDKKAKKEKKERKKRKEREGAEGEEEDDELLSVRSGKKDKKEKKAKKAKEGQA